MIADAYVYADGGKISRELKLAKQINRFGAQAIFGRAMGAKEINRIITAENVVKMYLERKQAKNAAEYAGSHQAELNYLNWAAGLVENGE